jgi:phospholipid/cholesterol/gamma-HCH transport system substrate-binding protein
VVLRTIWYYFMDKSITLIKKKPSFQHIQMTISKEARIGILASLTIFAAIWGYKFLKSESIIDRALILNVEFDNVEQLTKSSPVFFRGVQIGSVKDFAFQANKGMKPNIIIKISQNPGIPKDAIIALFNNGALAGKAIELKFSKPCAGGNCAETGDTLQGISIGMLESMLGKPDALDPYMMKLTNGMRGVYDTLKSDIGQPDNEVGKSLRDIQATLASLRASTTALNQVMAASAGSITMSMKNMETITTNLKNNNDKISSMFASANEVAGKANTVDFAKINKATEGVGQNLDELKKTLNETQATLKGLNATFQKVSSGEGTVGQFVTNDSVYNSLNQTLLHTNALMQDIRLNPKRYLNLNPFKKYKSYVVPSQDPLMDTLQKHFNATQRGKN